MIDAELPETVTEPATPWRRVFALFVAARRAVMQGDLAQKDFTQAEFARLLGVDRSKISRALDDEKGLISGRDQERILAAARVSRVTIVPSDLTPEA